MDTHQSMLAKRKEIYASENTYTTSRETNPKNPASPITF
jgi:hypothetical protein